jgi:hypothetical protein
VISTLDFEVHIFGNSFSERVTLLLPSLEQAMPCATSTVVRSGHYSASDRTFRATRWKRRIGISGTPLRYALEAANRHEAFYGHTDQAASPRDVLAFVQSRLLALPEHLESARSTF